MMPLLAAYQLAIPEIGRDRRLRLCISIHVPRLDPVAAPAPAPLVDEIPREKKLGRPSLRPEGTPQGIWAQWRRNVSSRGQDDTPEAFAAWVARRRHTVPAKHLRSWWEGRSRDPEVVWVTVIHRKDLSPAAEADWRRRIARARSGDPVYRIHLRGIQRREVR